MSVDGINPRHKETYPNMRLIAAESGNRSRVEGGQYIIQFVYETLSSTFVQVKDDTIDYELNGLRRLRRQSIAAAGTDFQKTVGTTTITSQIDDEAAVTLFLSSYEVDDTDASRTVEETYIEAGTLSVSTRQLSEGVQQETKEFLVTEGTTTGPIISRTTDNFLGLKRITVTTMQDKNGNSIVGSDPNLVSEYKTFRPFQYPGVVRFSVSETDNRIVRINEVIERPPAQADVLCTVYEFFQTSPNIVAADYTYQSADGLWSPNNWASSTISIAGSAGGVNITKGYRGYRTSTDSVSGSVFQQTFAFAAALINNKVIAANETSISYSVTTEKGPPDPIGNQYVLSASIKPAFNDINGTNYYKKTIIVTDAIPDQVATASLPYS
jgi:hypothetical protein